MGLPNVGKSTLFNTLTKMGIPAENFPFCTIEPNNVWLYLIALLRYTENINAPIAQAPVCPEGNPEAVLTLMQARVNVPDDRFRWLCSTYEPKSQVPAFLEIVDIAGLVKYAFIALSLQTTLSQTNVLRTMTAACPESPTETHKPSDTCHSEDLLRSLASVCSARQQLSHK